MITLTIGAVWAWKRTTWAPVSMMAGVDTLIGAFWLGALNWHPLPGILFTLGVFLLVCGLEAHITRGRRSLGV